MTIKLKRSQIKKFELQTELIKLFQLMLKDKNFGTSEQRLHIKLRLKGAQRWLAKMQLSEKDYIFGTVGDVVADDKVISHFLECIKCWYSTGSFDLLPYMIDSRLYKKLKTKTIGDKYSSKSSITERK